MTPNPKEKPMTATQLAEEAKALADAQPDPSDEPIEGELVDSDVQATPTAGTALAIAEHDGDQILGGLSLIPQQSELQNLAQLAVTFSAASIVPAALRGKPNDILLVLLTARDLNLSVTVALRECHVIDGRVTVSPKLKLATIRSRGMGRVWPDPNNDCAEAKWYAQRSDDMSITYTSTYTWEQAQRAGLAGLGCTAGNHASGAACKCKNNWHNYPERMLSWRAVGYLVDDVFGEVGTGLYSPDELGAITDEDGNAVIDVNEVPPLDGMASPRSARRRSSTSGNTRQADPAEVASEDDRARLKALLESLPPPAIEVAKRVWAENHLGKVEHLPGVKVKVADAVLAMIVKRAEGGEWGVWTGRTPEGVSTPLDGAEAAPEAQEATTVPDGDPEPVEADLVCCGPGCSELAVTITEQGEAFCGEHAPFDADPEGGSGE